MVEQMDLFEEQYKTLSWLQQFVSELHPTGGINDDGTLQYIEYELDFFHTLAFIVVYQEKGDGETKEKVIDNCVELEEIKKGFYKIIKIDGATLGIIDNPIIYKKQKELLSYFENQEVFKL